MVICPKCGTQYDQGTELCQKCGSFLMNEGGFLAGSGTGSSSSEEITRGFCPKCKVPCNIGNYCPKCGSLLTEGGIFQTASVQPLDKKAVKRMSKEYVTVFKEKKKLNDCLAKLEMQRGKVSSDALHSLFIRYQQQLNKLSFRHQEIEAEFESIRKRASEEVDLIEKELIPIQKRFDEFHSLYQFGSMAKADFLKEKTQLSREIKSKKRDLKNNQQILSLISPLMEERIVLPGIAEKLFRPFPIILAGGILMILAAGAYFISSWHSPSRPALYKETVTPLASAPSDEDQEVEKIKSLFENIKQANLKKNIDLFMSCYSHDFVERNEKRLATLETWRNFDYIDLSYEVIKKTITLDTANIRVEWMFKISQKMSGKQKEKSTTLDITLKKEEGHWKIKEIIPVT